MTTFISFGLLHDFIVTSVDAHNPSVLVVGAGAIGAFYGSVLARQGARVSVVCRSDADVVKRDGFAFTSVTLGDYVFRPERVVREVADYPPSPDYLILTVKVLEGEDRVRLIRPAVGPRTVIVLLENGIDIEPEIVQAFPQNEILSCLAFVGVSRIAPGRISHQLFGHLMLGKFPTGVTPAATRLGALWEAGGIACEVTENVVTARWQKAAWNAVFNPLSIMGGTLTTAHVLSSPAAEDFVRQAMEEVCAVAAACGHPVPADVVDAHLRDTHAMPPYKTSMALDYENGRPMEVEAIIGNTVRSGRRAGVPIPKLEALYAITKMIEHKARERG
jgi:2-dehydropantoate 2-reductase